MERDRTVKRVYVGECAGRLLRSNPGRQHSNALYRWEVRRRGKIGKHEKVEVKRKW